jgi:hypothetical protein
MGMTLAPGANCTIAVIFTPAAGGARQTSLTVMATPGGSDSATLSGTGQTSAAIAASPTAEDFGTVVQGSNATATVTITNQGDVATSMLSTSLSGSEYAIVTNTCNVALAAHATCSITLRFTPAGTGARPAGSLTVSGSTGGTASVPLSGTGVANGNLTITPTTLSANGQLIGTTSGVTTFTVHNTGGVFSGIITMALTGTSASEFRITNNGCLNAMLPATGSCMVDVVFSPTTAGSKTASLTATASPGGTAVAALSGIGQAPGSLSFSPTSAGFASTVYATPATSPPAR